MKLRILDDSISAWAADESQVGIRETLRLDDGQLKVLIEKDFECLEPRPGESQSNLFRNPKAGR